MPLAICQAVVDRIDAEPKHCPHSEATELVALLLRNYPEFKAHDAKGYTMALFEIFSAYPQSIGLRVVDSVIGLPSKLKYTPKSAEVSQALTAEVKRRDLIRANALSHIRESERRAVEAKQEKKYEKRISPERISELTSSLKAMPINEPVAGREPGFRPSAELLAELDERKAQRLAEQTEVA